MSSGIGECCESARYRRAQQVHLLARVGNWTELVRVIGLLEMAPAIAWPANAAHACAGLDTCIT